MTGLLERFRRLERPRILPLAIILVVLAGSILLGWQGTPRLIFLVAASLSGMVAFIWLTRNIEWGILALVPVTFLVSFSMGTGTQTSINMTILLSLLLLGVWVLRIFVFDRQVTLAKSAANLPAMLFIVTVLLSLIAGDIPWMPQVSARASTFSQIGGVLMLVLPLGVLLLVGNLFRQEKWLRWMFWAFIVVGAPYLVARLSPGGWRVLTLYNEKSVSALFHIWYAAFCGGMLLFNPDFKPWKRWLLVGLLSFSLAVSVGPMRSNASFWVPTMIVLGVLLALRWWRMGVLLGLSIGVVLVLRFQQIVELLLRTEEYSAMTRAATWPIMYQLVKASPLLGLGPSNYYFYTSQFSLMGYYLQFNSHNNYWDLAVQVGLLGLGLFLWLMYSLGRSAWRLRKRALNGFQRGYAYAALAGLIGTLAVGMLADWFMPFVYNIGFNGFRGAVFAWMFLGGLIALDGMNQK